LKVPDGETGVPCVAAVDCGTNSTRLLIARADGVTVDRRMRITRLGEGVDSSGELQPAAISRTLAVLREYGDAITSAGASAVMVVATSAIRDAVNSACFLQPAARVLGTELRVLSGLAEGQLSYRGATSELPSSLGPYLVVDLGGGSTELVCGGARGGGAPVESVEAPESVEAAKSAEAPESVEAPGSVEVVSLDVGCVRVTERFLGSDPPSQAELEAARSYVARLVRTAAVEHPAFVAATRVEAELPGYGVDVALPGARAFGTPGAVHARRLVGLAGTVSALTMLSLGLESYDRTAVHHAHLTRDEVSRLSGVLATEDVSTRRSRRGMEHDRADVIVGGAVVLLTIMEMLGYDDLIVSESDILDGMVAELLAG